MDPQFYRHMILFTKTTLVDAKEKQAKRANAMLEFTKWSIDVIEEKMRNTPGMEEACSYSASGVLDLAFTKEHLGKLSTGVTIYNAEPAVKVSREQILDEMEPWLKHSVRAATLQGGRLQPSAARGVAARFTEQLARECTDDLGVKFHFNTPLESVTLEKGRIVALHTPGKTFEIDDRTEVVIAGGSWTPQLLAKLDLFCPMYPMKGYNLIAPNLGPAAQPRRVIVDDFVYIAPMSDELRITSVGEFAGWSTVPRPDIVEKLRDHALKLFPAEARPAIESAKPVCGLRPFTSDGLLILGRVGEVENLSVNTGPGFNGWKTALGAARLLAEEIVERPEEGERKTLEFDPKVFSPKGRVKSAPIFVALTLLLSPFF